MRAINRLRNKLLLSAAAIGGIITLGFMLAVAWVIDRQFQDETKRDLSKVSEVISKELSERRGGVLLAARQLATQKNLGSTIWYLAKYGQSSADREMLFITYQQLAKDTGKISRVAKLSKLAVYDGSGHLVAFALAGKNGEQVGFVRNIVTPVFHVASLTEGEEVGRNNLRTTQSFAGMGFEFGGRIPQRESVRYGAMEGKLLIESQVPIMGEVFNADTGKQEIRQLGLVVAAQPLDQTFVDRFSGYTHAKINVFTRTGLSGGSVPDYPTPDWRGVSQTGDDSLPPVFNEIPIAGTDYYQSLIPLYADKELVGGIAALHSRESVRKNTQEMMRILGGIATASLLLFFALAWYFATSISRPITALSRIFHGVASGKHVGTQSGELDHLRNESRRDELGDLTHSFIAMNDAVNQQILQVNEINASLERTVNERTAALAAREQEARTLIENTPDTIARYDIECRRLYVNPAFGALAEGGVAALLGKKPSEIPGGENSEIYESKIREVFASGQDTQFELKWPGKDGREICSHIRLTAERDLSGNIISVLGVGRDITELNESRAEIERKELAKSRFLAAAGHDLRQPLAAANLFVDALKAADPTPHQSEIIGRLDQAMHTFNGLLNSLLDISKLDAGIIRPEYTSIEVAELFSWLEQNLEPLAREKSIGFRLHFPLHAALVVRGDIGLLRSALMNFVSNAIKFTATGAVLVSARRRGNEVLFQVWDTGIGIADADLKFIFDEFYQTNNPQRDRSSGLGLGLAIAKRALTLLGAKIECRSKIGHGSVFEFRLPLEASPNAVTHHDKTVSLPENMTVRSFVRGRHFVVVEDDKLVAQAMTNVLEEMGGKVECFHRAEDALHQADIGHAEFFIVDYMLGGNLNGLQLLNQVRQKTGKPIRAVLMTGDTSPAFIREVANCDWPVLHKPTDIMKLAASLSAQVAAQ